MPEGTPSASTTRTPHPHRCRISGNHHAVIRKYGLNIDRQSFRENAEMLGWRKYN